MPMAMADTQDTPASTNASAKSKKNKKKKKPAGTNSAATPSTNGDSTTATTTNGLGDAEQAEGEEEEVDAAQQGEHEESEKTHSAPLTTTNPIESAAEQSDDSDLKNKLDALEKERDQLRKEVAEFRQSLEQIQSKHDADLEDVKIQLQEAEAGRDQAETAHKNLKERVTTITATLGERMRANTEEIAQNNARIEELEEQSRALEDENKDLDQSLQQQRKQNELQSQEIDSLRERSTTTQSGWIKEREELIAREAYVREEYDQARQAMQDWEVLAMEERSMREALKEQVVDLEEQLSTIKDSHERAASDRDSQSQTVDNLQRALREIQEARKKELREIVESSEAQLEQVRKSQQEAESIASTSKAELETAQRELERALPFEKEVKEKNLLIGKLRHEGVILNDHLTKALRFIKQRNPEDMVNRQVVTNHFIHFITLDRADPKRFQILQIIAGMLGWTDEQKEKTGLTRPGASNIASNLRVPLSPFRKSSAGSLHTAADVASPSSKENLADLWSDFLEREAAEGLDSSRRPSTASQMTEPRPGPA